MNAETFFGTILIASWVVVVLRGIERSAWRQGRDADGSGRILSAWASAAHSEGGAALSLNNSLPGFLLAAGAGFAICAFGRRVPAGGRKPHPSKQNGTGFCESIAVDSTG
jgi:hypothetical protein